MTRFLDEFLTDTPAQQVIATDPLPVGERDVMLLDPALFGEDEIHAHDHSQDEKIGSCGNACNSCPSRGTPACGDHEH